MVTTPVGEEMPHLFAANTVKWAAAGKSMISSSNATRGVEVMKEMVAVWSAIEAAGPSFETADATTAVTAPTADTSTKAAILSIEVSIFNPVFGASALTATLADRVSPEHVTFTGPAASVE